MEFRILGPLEVCDDDGRAVRVREGQQRILLLVLLLHADEIVSSDRLVDAIWGERAPRSAPKILQGYVSQLRRSLGVDVIRTRSTGYAFTLGSNDLDLRRFEELVERARQLDAAEGVAVLEEALALWRGEPLPELAYASFGQSEIARLRELRLAAFEERAARELELGRHAQLIGEIERVLAEDPLREHLRRLLMLTLYRSGRQAEALGVYQEGRRMLVEELGIEPSKALQNLQLQILSQDPALDLATGGDEGRGEDPARHEQVAVEAAAPDAGPVAPARQERKVVTVVCIELVRSRASPLDAEEAHALLRRPFDVVRDELETFGAFMEKRIGDVVIAFFGAPRAHEDAPLRAVRAAFAARDAIAREATPPQALAVELRVAVSTDDALVVIDAAHDAAESMVIGEPVNTALHLREVAAPGAIIVDDRTHRATANAVEYRRLPSPPGSEAAATAWEAMAVELPKPASEVELPTTPFVGRSRELAFLAGALERMRATCDPELVTLVGAPGIGKTRLVRELLRDVEPDRPSTSVLRGRCLPYGNGVALWALGEIVKLHAGILETDAADTAERKLGAALDAAVAAERRWIEPHLRPLIGLQTEGEQLEGSGAAFNAWRSFFEALATQRPLVLVFEDLQWADDVLLDFIDHLTEWARGVPIFVLCTARPELLQRRPSWGGGKLNASTLTVSPLAPDDAARLVTVLVEGRDLSPKVQEILIERAGGNPLFAEQIVRMASNDAVELPDTVYGVIAAQLDLLDAYDKSLLQDAAIVGETFWAGALAGIGARDESAVIDRLHGLERNELVLRQRTSSVGGDTEYAFRHALIRDVCYSQIPRAVRADRHGAVAEWIEALSDRTDEVSELLAYHYTTALQIVRSIGDDDAELVRGARLALRDAGDRTRGLHSFVAAEGYYEEALALWPEEDRERPLLAFHALVVRAERSEASELEREFEGVRDALVRVGDAEHAAAAEVRMANFPRLSGDHERASALLFQALKRLEALPDSPAKAEVLYAMTLNYGLASRSEQCIEYGRRALAVADAIGYRDLAAGARSIVGYARIDTGDLEGIADLEAAIAERERLNSHEVALSYLNAGSATAELIGDVRRGYELHERAAAAAARFGIAWVLHHENARQALCLYWLGRLDEAAARVEAYLESSGGHHRYAEPGARSVRSRIARAHGHTVEAREEAGLALRTAREVADPQVLFPALAWRARIEADSPAGDEPADELLELWRGHRGHGLAAYWLLDLARALETLGRADDFLQTAERLPSPSRWQEAAVAWARQDYREAARLLEDIGSVVDAAAAHACAADRAPAGASGPT